MTDEIDPQILAQATAQMQARIKAIVASDEAKKVPNFASHLAFETDVSAEQAIEAMRALLVDLQTQGQARKAALTPESYEARKCAAGSLGLALLDDGADGWKKAVDEANERVEARGYEHGPH